MLNHKSNKPAGQRKEYWEDLRKNHVPRFLFRAFNSKTGGGRGNMINNTHELVPHGFMHGRPGYQFYEMTERQISIMANKHYDGEKTGFTEFSSWAASLHLVLCFAHSMGLESDPQIAVLDRKALGPQVLIWHAPQLIGRGSHEYLAHGVIRGKGYTAVSFQELLHHGLPIVFPEIISPPYDVWGDTLRLLMFCREPEDISEAQAAAIRTMGSLFRNLSLPVMVALSCLCRRIWLGIEDSGIPNAQTAGNFTRLLGIDKVSMSLACESWLEPNAVSTDLDGYSGSFPDVRQWIGLLYSIAKSHEQEAERKKAEQRKAARERYNFRPLPGRRN